MFDVACFCTQSRRIARSLTDAYDKALEPSGLKVTQFSVLRMIGRLDAPTIGAVAEATGLERSTLGRNLKVLQKAGFVRLSAGLDERARVVEISKAGQRAVNQALPLWEQMQRKIEARLPAEMRAALSAVPALLAR